ncbi:hypothetical protein SME06J_09960 [Serratia marcescens]|nr:hypothetical protein SME06J_09960 [Serratia marcescens]
MSRVETLVKSRDNLSVKFMEFTRIASKNMYAIFFEGEDEKYYSVRINSIRPDLKWSGVNCGGKCNVLNIRKKIRTHQVYATALSMFFVDADFDDNSELTECFDVYVTPCYSVENFYTSKEAFVRVLSAEFGVNEFSDTGSCFNNAIDAFKETKDSYLDAIKEFNFLIRELRLKENRSELIGRLNINNVKFESLIKVDIGRVEKLYDEKIPNSIFPDLSDGLDLQLDNSKQYFSDMSTEKWFRGKQNLEFLRVFIDQIKIERCKKGERKIFKDKGNVKLQTTKGNFISELSQYADTSPCLLDFLRKQEAQCYAA